MLPYPDPDDIAARRKEFGQQLRAARLARGLSQEDVANTAGLDRPSLVRIEAGQVDPRLSTLLRLVVVLDLGLHLTCEDE